MIRSLKEYYSIFPKEKWQKSYNKMTTEELIENLLNIVGGATYENQRAEQYTCAILLSRGFSQKKVNILLKNALDKAFSFQILPPIGVQEQSFWIVGKTDVEE